MKESFINDSQGLIPPRNRKLIFKKDVLYIMKSTNQSPNINLEFSTYLDVHNSMIDKGKSYLKYQFLFKGVAALAYIDNNTHVRQYKKEYLLRHQYDYSVQFINLNRPQYRDQSFEESKNEVEEIKNNEGDEPDSEYHHGLPVDEYRRIKIDFVINIYNTKLQPSIWYRHPNGNMGFKVSYSIEWKIMKEENSFNYFQGNKFSKKFFLRIYLGLNEKEKVPEYSFSLPVKLPWRSIPLKTIPKNKKLTESLAKPHITDGDELKIEENIDYPRVFYEKSSEVKVFLVGEIILSRNYQFNGFIYGNDQEGNQNTESYVSFKHNGLAKDKAIFQGLYNPNHPRKQVLQTIDFLFKDKSYGIKMEFHLTAYHEYRRKFFFSTPRKKLIGLKKTHVTIPDSKLSSQDEEALNGIGSERGVINISDDPNMNPIGVKYITDQEISNYWNGRGEYKFRNNGRLWENNSI